MLLHCYLGFVEHRGSSSCTATRLARHCQIFQDDTVHHTSLTHTVYRPPFPSLLLGINTTSSIFMELAPELVCLVFQSLDTPSRMWPTSPLLPDSSMTYDEIMRMLSISLSLPAVSHASRMLKPCWKHKRRIAYGTAYRLLLTQTPSHVPG